MLDQLFELVVVSLDTLGDLADLLVALLCFLDNFVLLLVNSLHLASHADDPLNNPIQSVIHLLVLFLELLHRLQLLLIGLVQPAVTAPLMNVMILLFDLVQHLNSLKMYVLFACLSESEPCWVLRNCSGRCSCFNVLICPQGASSSSPLSSAYARESR
jgi:uncharacterized protein YhhL (DUF1145 family)